MFHRVKSASQEAPQTSKESPHVQEEQAEDAHDEMPENAAQTQYQKEETQDMPKDQEAEQQQTAQTAPQPQQPPVQQPQAAQAQTQTQPRDVPAAAVPPRAPGAYAAAAYPAYGRKAVEAAQAAEPEVDSDDDSHDDESRLVIGQGIAISGEIESCHTLVVEGTVEASLKGARIVEIEETGIFYGAIEIEEATISGRFEGELVVNGRLSVTSTGTITGTIAYKELEIEAGAMIDGKLTPIREGGAAQQSQPQARPTVRNAQKKAAQRSAQQPANELFPSHRAAAAE